MVSRKQDGHGITIAVPPRSARSLGLTQWRGAVYLGSQDGRPAGVLEVLVFYIYEIVLFLLLFLLFFRSSQYTAQILVGRGRRGKRTDFLFPRRQELKPEGRKKGRIAQITENS